MSFPSVEISTRNIDLAFSCYTLCIAVTWRCSFVFFLPSNGNKARQSLAVFEDNFFLY